MRSVVASRIMARTTLNLDDIVLAELKAVGDRERKSLGELASELLAVALRTRVTQPAPAPSKLRWHSQDMAPRVDLADKEAIQDLLDEDFFPRRP
jgi:hypothetical protein